MPTQQDKTIISAAARWDINVRAIRKDIDICGSPERCESRFAIECADDNLYVIESLFGDEVNHKHNIISSLNHLSRQGLTGINPYIPSKANTYIVKTNDKFWQISRFVDGSALIRPEYVFDQWRGNVLADFLIDLHLKSENMPGFDGKPSFSIINYINTLIDQIKAYEPDLQKKIQPVINFLGNRFTRTHDSLKTCFCHGDFHALNAIWSDDGINAVIDWDFFGHQTGNL